MDFSITVPVYNEERQLEQSILALVDAVERLAVRSFEILIADNGSNDRTPKIGQKLTMEVPSVKYVRTAQRGRGSAIKNAWLASSARVLAYTDVDLSTDLMHLPALYYPVYRQDCDLAIGTRFHHKARVQRGFKREIISRCYRWLARTMLGAVATDFQCGFKSISKPAALRVLPLIEDQAWFFDTELIAIAATLNYRILEIPVNWNDDLDSRVKLWSASIASCRGLRRLRRRLRRHYSDPALL